MIVFNNPAQIDECPNVELKRSWVFLCGSYKPRPWEISGDRGKKFLWFYECGVAGDNIWEQRLSGGR